MCWDEKTLKKLASLELSYWHHLIGYIERPGGLACYYNNVHLGWILLVNDTWVIQLGDYKSPITRDSLEDVKFDMSELIMDHVQFLIRNPEEKDLLNGIKARIHFCCGK